MIDCAKEQNVGLRNVNDFLTNSCEKEQITYLSWKFTPNKHTICSDVETKWKDLKNFLKSKSLDKVKVQLMRFEKNRPYKKSGNEC